MIDAQKRAALEARRLALFGSPATDARPTPEPVDSTVFERGALKGRKKDRFERVVHELDPETLLPLVAAGDPDACRVYEDNKAAIAWWSAEAAAREAAAAPARALADQRQAIAQAGLEVPEGVAVETFYEAHRGEIRRLEAAALQRAQAAELVRQADRAAEEVAAALAEKKAKP